MVIGNGDGGPVFHDFPELEAEFDPSRSVFSMMVGLITGKKEQVGVYLFQVVDDVGARSWIPA